MVLVSDGFPTHATVKLHFFNTFMKFHHMVTKLPLLPLCAIDPFTQAMNLQQAKLYREERQRKVQEKSKRLLSRLSQDPQQQEKNSSHFDVVVD